MTFTTSTLRKLRALNLGQDIEDQILAIFEEAKEAKKRGCVADRKERGTRLPDNWELPTEWREWALAIGVRPNEVARETEKFRNYWRAQAGTKGIKLDWRGTWRNWCISMLERAGRPILTPPENGSGAANGSQEGPQAFTDATWAAIAKRVKAGQPWNPLWGPEPGMMDCQMPMQYL